MSEKVKGVEIIKGPQVFDHPGQILELDIIDFNRLNGAFKNSLDALNTIFSWYNGLAGFTVARINDFDDAPVRKDFPGWKHAGCHEEFGRRFWNWFLWKHPDASLCLADQPDFWGQFSDGHYFKGDIGKVSASTFALTQKRMFAHDIWISVLDEEMQVVIEPFITVVDHMEYW